MSMHNGHNAPPPEHTEGNTELSFYSEEVQEVLNRTPTWMERSGNSLLLALLALGLILLWYIHYPDTLQFRAQLLPGKPAVIARADQALKTSRLLVPDGSLVVTGQPILQAVNESGQETTLKATDNGIIQFLSQIEPGQTLEKDQLLYTITFPELPPKVKLFVQENSQRRIKLGQKVLLQDDLTPGSNEKALEAVVVRKSIVPKDGLYEVGVEVKDKYDALFSEQPVTATIILEDRRLIQHFFRF